ncbi:HipA N-terminal domain-containing protein [Aquimarina sp. U1-2]|uniref:HipA N-terminal domain-containing protein n=1 Tax=Aquimarina sp. U1-2 TaxID=2823141 RepID=UPI001AECD6DA|nr:HipA N-terminal domain-containing protein [Aquimarina sp. U1-2]MBP2831030.1 HipA N-terminal domain-containing protein [Aquimarina sp. U1-2]
MRQAKVFYKNEEAGLLTQLDNGEFIFQYLDVWFNAANKPSISLTLPKTQKEFSSPYLFPFFYNMLPEGTNKEVVCFALRIDKNDHFGILLNTAKYDTIGAVRIEKIENQ